MNKVFKLFLLLIFCQQSDASDLRMWSLCRENLSRLTSVGATVLATVLTGPFGGLATLYANYLWDKYSSASNRIEAAKRLDLSVLVATAEQLQRRIEHVDRSLENVDSNQAGVLDEAEKVKKLVDGIRREVDRNSIDITNFSVRQVSVNDEIGKIGQRVSELEAYVCCIENEVLQLEQQIEKSNAAQRAELCNLAFLSRVCGRESEAVLKTQIELSKLVSRDDELLQQACTKLQELRGIRVDVSSRIIKLESVIGEQLKIQREINANLNLWPAAFVFDTSKSFQRSVIERGLAVTVTGNK